MDKGEAGASRRPAQEIRYLALNGGDIATENVDTRHSVSECVFQVPKTYQAPAHIWGLPRAQVMEVIIIDVEDF